MHLTDNVDIAKLLVDNGADVNARDNYGKTPLHCIRGIETPVHLTDNVDVAKLLIENGANVNARDNYGWTPLHCACAIRCNTEVAKLLIENGADINAKDNKGKTPLDVVCEHYEAEKIKEEIFKLRQQCCRNLNIL